MSRRGGARVITGVLAGVAVIVGLLYGGYHLSRSRCFAVGAPVVCRVETTAPKVALTFDDGPTQLGLDRVLPDLERHGAKATFFVTGREAAARPDLLQSLAAAGHEIGNHSYSHKRMMLKSRGFYDREIARTEEVLARAGVASGLFRPPYSKKLFGLGPSVRAHGLKMITWDVEDPVTSDPQAFADQVLAKARPGSIILVHPMYRTNETGRQALPLILEGLKSKGLAVVTVGELLAETGVGKP